MSTLASSSSAAVRELEGQMARATLTDPDRQCSSIDELVAALSGSARGANKYQVETLQRLQRRAEADQMYLDGYTPSPMPSGAVQGTFSVLGAMRKSVRESYDVRLFKPGASPKGSFWCSCADMKFNASKRGTVCKHICFVVCKVAKILSPAYFETKHLTDDQFHDLAALASRSLAVELGKTEEPRGGFAPNLGRIDADDVCPICYDPMSVTGAGPGAGGVVACPSCKNNVHASCMRVWCERQTTCVMCRSDVWRDFLRGPAPPRGRSRGYI